MKTTLLPLTVLLLASGVNAAPAVTLSTLTLGGIGSTLLIGAPAKLTVTATGSDGRPFPGTPTFTSSDPNVVTVAADGTLTVKHLNVKPVTLTATEHGRSATLKIGTYGLDASGGTYVSMFNKTAPGYIFILAFRDARGQALAAPAVFTVQGPAGFNYGAPIERPMDAGATVQGYAWTRDSTVPVVTGTYVASGAVDGVMYTKTFTIDASKVQAIPSSVKVTFDAVRYSATGTLPAGAPLTHGVLYKDRPEEDAGYDEFVNFLEYFKKLPVDGKFETPLPGGRYYIAVISESYHEERSEAFPDQINIAASYSAYVTVPDSASRPNGSHK